MTVLTVNVNTFSTVCSIFSLYELGSQVTSIVHGSMKFLNQVEDISKQIYPTNCYGFKLQSCSVCI